MAIKRASIKQTSPVGADETEEIFRELETDVEPTKQASESAIEEKYDKGQASIIIQRNDFLVPNILEMIKNKEILNVSPPYQRRARWTDLKRSFLIESLLMNVPIPPVFLYETDLARYEVMDGQQRLTAIRAFFSNEFALRGLRKWTELNGRRFSELPSRIQNGLARRGLAAVIILTESGKDVQTATELRQYVFERLNTGGQPLNAQEVRNCLYASPFNDMLVAIARSAEFTHAWGIPGKEASEPHQISRALERNRLYATMADCEIVLRYFALSDLSNFKGGMKRTLDLFMKSMQSATRTQCAAMHKEYVEVLVTASSVYGNGLFRLIRDSDLSGRRSVPLADAVLLAIRRHHQKQESIIEKKAQIVLETKKLLSDQAGYEILVGRGNTRAAIRDRIELMAKVIH